jgi:hypothetical protein
MRDGRHTVPLEIVHDETVPSGPELRQEWLRDIGMLWDSGKNAYEEKSRIRVAAPGKTMWRTLKAQSSLLTVRFADEKLLGGDVESAEQPHITGTLSTTGGFSSSYSSAEVSPALVLCCLLRQKRRMKDQVSTSRLPTGRGHPWDYTSNEI